MEILFKNMLFIDGIGGVKIAKKKLKLTKNILELHWSLELLCTATDAKTLIWNHLLRTFWTAGKHILIMGPF